MYMFLSHVFRKQTPSFDHQRIQEHCHNNVTAESLHYKLNLIDFQIVSYTGSPFRKTLATVNLKPF